MLRPLTASPDLHRCCSPRPGAQIRPDSSRYMAWSSLVLLSDLTYSAFIVPISL